MAPRAALPRSLAPPRLPQPLPALPARRPLLGGEWRAHGCCLRFCRALLPATRARAMPRGPATAFICHHAAELDVNCSLPTHTPRSSPSRSHPAAATPSRCVCAAAQPRGVPAVPTGGSPTSSSTLASARGFSMQQMRGRLRKLRWLDLAGAAMMMIGWAPFFFLLSLFGGPGLFVWCVMACFFLMPLALRLSS